MLRWWNELDSLKRGRQDQSHVTAAKKSQIQSRAKRRQNQSKSQ